ncbi:MAG: exodeoxyribonuclease III [Actinomycetota bacterium]|nr:exodeoxyribonuclease III [Actinomycetota bacterium]
MKVATWNVNSLKARINRVLDWIATNQVDVLMIQETKLKQDAFFHDRFAEIGYRSVHFGQGQWNGVAIVAKGEMTEVSYGLLGETFDEARAISAVVDGVRFFSLYVPNGRSLDNDHYRYKLDFLDKLAEQVKDLVSSDTPLILGGDFNIAPNSLDVYDESAFVGMTHVSSEERRRVENLRELGLGDLFRIYNPGEAAFTWWDYRNGAFHKNQGMRIDLLFGTNSVVKGLCNVVVDREERKGGGKEERPSDHAPLIATFDLL